MFLVSFALAILGRPLLPSPAGAKFDEKNVDPCTGATGAALGKALAPSPLLVADRGLLVTMEAYVVVDDFFVLTSNKESSAPDLRGVVFQHSHSSSHLSYEFLALP